MTPKPWRARSVWLGLAACLLPGALPSGGPAAAPPAPDPVTGEGVPITSADQLQRLKPRDFDQLFSLGEAVPIPPGFARGRVLTLVGRRLPRVSAGVGNLVWKGKHFKEDGEFINQWLGFRALHSRAVIEPSWFDGSPCVALQYPPGTPLFANMRDEFRQIGPCLFLSRIYQRCPPRLRGYIALEVEAAEEGRVP